MDVLKLILGVIGFVIILLTAFLVIQPGSGTGQITGRAVLDDACACVSGQTCFNNECKSNNYAQKPNWYASESFDFKITHSLEKTVLGFGDETRLVITLFNDDAVNDRTVTPLPPIMVKHDYELGVDVEKTSKWAFQMSDEQFTLGNKYYNPSKVLVLDFKSPDNSAFDRELHGEYELVTPFNVDGSIIYATSKIDLGLSYDVSVRVLPDETEAFVNSLSSETDISPCEAYAVIKEEPSPGDLLNPGVLKVIVPFCNYGDSNQWFTVTGVVNNYDYYELNVTDCSEEVRVKPGLQDYEEPFTCEVSLYPKCNGKLHLNVEDLNGEEDIPDDTVEYRGWLFSMQDYCFLEPHNALFEDFYFNGDVDNPVITAQVLNRFGTRDVTVQFVITNTDDQEVIVCEDTQFYMENDLKTINCAVRRDGLPYSFWGGGKNIIGRIISDDYAGDNEVTLSNRPVFEFVNVGLVPGSLTAWRHASLHYARFSFQIYNSGDKDKGVTYELWGKKIDDLTDPDSSDCKVCEGVQNVPAGQAVTVNCDLGSDDFNCDPLYNRLTIIDCDFEDGCTFDGSKTLWATIDVDYQDAAAFNAQEELSTSLNSFIVPIFESLEVKELKTPEKS
jgi:hypothetical protein